MSGEPLTIELVPRIAAAEDALAVRALTCAGRTPRYGDAAQKLTVVRRLDVDYSLYAVDLAP